MMTKKLFLLVLALLLCAIAHAAQDWNTIFYETQDGARIYTQKCGDRRYLFLPGDCDLSSISLHGFGNIKLPENAAAGKYYTVTLNGEKLYVIKGSDIPSLHFSLNESRSYIDASKDNRAEGGSIILHGSPCEGVYPLDWIHARGNSSFLHSDKKSYTFKLDSKAELVPGAGKGKKWVLIANNVHDKTGLANYSAKELYSAINGAYALSQQSVDVYINGEYLGMYMLIEKIEINSSVIDIAKPETQEDAASVTRVVGSCGLFMDGSTRWISDKGATFTISKDEVNTVTYRSKEEDSADPATAAGVRAYQYSTNSVETEKGGFIIELDFRFDDAEAWFVTKNGACFAVKQPECASKEQVQRIAAYVQEFENALFSPSGINTVGKRYTEYADMGSFARLLAVEGFTSNHDAFLASTYMSCDFIDGGFGLITAGPIWDNDYIDYYQNSLLNNNMGRTRSAISGYPLHPWVKQLMMRADFVETLREVWLNDLRPAAEKLYLEDLPVHIQEVAASNRMNSLVLDNGGEGRKEAFLSQNALDGMIYRLNWWKSQGWQEHKLQSAHIVNDNGTLTIEKTGIVRSITWYRLNDDNTCSRIDGQTGFTYKPKSPGTYFAAVSGISLTYLEGSAGFMGQPETTLYLVPVTVE